MCFGSHTVGCPATLHLNETDIPFRFSLAGGFIQSHRVQFTNVGDYAFIFQKQLPLVLNDDREPYLTLRWYIRGKEVKLKYLTQTKARPPSFVLFSNSKEIGKTYLRFLSSCLQEEFDLNGVPIRIYVRVSENPYTVGMRFEVDG